MAAIKAAPIRLDAHETYGDYPDGGWQPGMICWAKWWVGDTQRTGVVYVIGAGWTKDDVDERDYWAAAREATAEEAAPLLAEQAHRAAGARQRQAESQLLRLRRADQQVPSEATNGWTEMLTLTPAGERHNRLSEYHDAYILADDVVIVTTTDNDNYDSPWWWRIQGEGVADLARKAAIKRTLPDGTNVPTGNPDLDAHTAAREVYAETTRFADFLTNVEPGGGEE